MYDRLSQRLIGARVRVARTAMDWTQDQLSDALGFNDRQSVSDIENGKRALKPDELVRLTDVLDRDIDFFIDPFVVAGEARFSWRAATGVARPVLEAFEAKAGPWIGLLRWLRAADGSNSPLQQTLRLSKYSTFEEAIACAESLVHALDFGLVPAERLAERIESRLDVPVLFVDAAIGEASISGATCHLPDLNVILVNRGESELRRSFDLAHELFHALTWAAMEPEHVESNDAPVSGKRSRIEQLADSFAAGLLMPRTSLDQLIDPRRIDSLDHLAEVAARLRVSPVALAWRLFNLKRIGEPMCQALRACAARDTTTTTPKRYSRSFVVMLHGAIERGRLSARKAAKAMAIGLPHLADLFAEHSLPVPFEI